MSFFRGTSSLVAIKPQGKPPIWGNPPKKQKTYPYGTQETFNCLDPGGRSKKSRSRQFAPGLRAGRCGDPFCSNCPSPRVPRCLVSRCLFCFLDSKSSGSQMFKGSLWIPRPRCLFRSLHLDQPPTPNPPHEKKQKAKKHQKPPFPPSPPFPPRQSGGGDLGFPGRSWPWPPARRPARSWAPSPWPSQSRRPGDGSKARNLSEHPNPHQNRLKWVVHYHKMIPLVLTHSHLKGSPREARARAPRGGNIRHPKRPRTNPPANRQKKRWKPKCSLWIH